MSKAFMDSFDDKWSYIRSHFPKEYQRVIDFENGANDFLGKIYELAKENDELRQINADLYRKLLENNIVYDVGSTNITIKNDL
jgi:hypothetical protein